VFSISEDSAPTERGFLGHVLFRPGAVVVEAERERLHAAHHRCDEPTILSPRMVASLHCPLPFHVAEIILALMTADYKLS